MAAKKLTRNKNPSEKPGDIRLDPLDILMGEQPLNARGKELVKRGYELFELFRQQNREAHMEMSDARKMRQLRHDERSRTAPTSMTLNSCIDNVVADQIDNTPEAVMIPEREETAGTADIMTDVVGFVMYQAGWPGKYQAIMEDAAVTGTGIAQVFWDEDAMDGDGLVSVLAWHPEDFYPDPMYENIQDGRGVFKTTLTTVAWVKEHYPDAAEYVKGDDIRPDDDDNHMIEAAMHDEKVTLLEFWYKRYDAKKRKYRVHMAQMAGRALLYSTELGIGCSEDEYKQGVYAHGQYPFILYKYRSVWRKPFGTGLMHDYAEQQHAIDRYQKYMDDNARESSVQKHFVRRGSGINPEDVVNYNRTVIEYEGGDPREIMTTVQASPLNSQVFQNMQYLVDSMKQDSGQNQFSRGEGGMGVTAGNAIEALIAQGGKITRWHAEQFKDAFREMVEQILWVLSEYLTEDRKIRIVGGWESSQSMQGEWIELKPTAKEGDEMKKPAYTVRVQTQKMNPYWTEHFNNLLLQASNAAAQGGMPIPPDVFVSMLQGYPDKGRIVKMLRQSGTMHDQIAQLQAQLEDAQNKIKGRDAVINSQAQALGTPSIAQESSGPDYDAFMAAQGSAGQNSGTAQR